MNGRILVIRGGAIGDFILTLPAIAMLRDAFPDAHIEILGYRHIAALADNRFYANATRSIDYAPLAGFFNPKSDLDPELCGYFSGFHQVISYLFDPDEFFAGNLARAGVSKLIRADPRLGDHAPAALQLAQPLQRLALFLEDAAATFFPSDADLTAAGEILAPLTTQSARLIAIHPGSGGERKNWPIERWTDFATHLLRHPETRLLVIGGEADTARIAHLRSQLTDPRATFLTDLPLPVLGAIFSLCTAFIGHDSGVSHLAAAADCPCLLLFGPTDPAVWAPQNPGVRVLASTSGQLSDIPLDSVIAAAESLLHDARRDESADPRN